MRQGGKEVESARFGRDNTTPAGVYLKTSGAAVMVVRKELYDSLDVKLSDLAEAPASPTTPAK